MPSKVLSAGTKIPRNEVSRRVRSATAGRVPEERSQPLCNRERLLRYVCELGYSEQVAASTVRSWARNAPWLKATFRPLSGKETLAWRRDRKWIVTIDDDPEAETPSTTRRKSA
jgi:hypothetical protein